MGFQIRTFDVPPASLDYLTSSIASTGRAERRTLDSYLAAQALALGISTICTYNAADFSGSDGLAVVAPDDLASPPPNSPVT